MMRREKLSDRGEAEVEVLLMGERVWSLVKHMDTHTQTHLKPRILMGGAATSSFDLSVDNTLPSTSACSDWVEHAVT